MHVPNLMLAYAQVNTLVIVSANHEIDHSTVAYFDVINRGGMWQQAKSLPDSCEAA